MLRAVMVGTYCCVPGCYNNTLKHRGLSFHNFPKALALRELWVRNIGSSAGGMSHLRWAPRAHNRVCDAHFQGGRKTYTVNVPTVFPAKKRPVREGGPGNHRPGFTRISTFVSHRGNIQSNTVQHDHDYSAPDSKDDLLKLLKQKTYMIQLLHEQLENLRQDYGITKRELSKNKKKIKSLLCENDRLWKKVKLGTKPRPAMVLNTLFSLGVGQQ